jgi:hypothetical protein
VRDTRRALAPYTLAVLLIVLAVLWIVGRVHGQATPQQQQYKPTEVQALKLQVAQRDAWLAQRDFLDAQRRYQEAVAALNRLGEDVKQENGWPKEVIFNADRAEFAAPNPRATTPPGGAR